MKSEGGKTEEDGEEGPGPGWKFSRCGVLLGLMMLLFCGLLTSKQPDRQTTVLTAQRPHFVSLLLLASRSGSLSMMCVSDRRLIRNHLRSQTKPISPREDLQ